MEYLGSTTPTREGEPIDQGAGSEGEFSLVSVIATFHHGEILFNFGVTKMRSITFVLVGMTC